MCSDNFIVEYFKKRFNQDIAPDIEALILESFRKETIKNKVLLFKAGDINSRHYVIEKGLLRLYLINNMGREYNILFAQEKQVIGDLVSPAPTSFFLETIEPSIVHSISSENLDSLLRRLNDLHSITSSNIITKAYINLQNRLVNIMACSAEENFIQFRDTFPGLIQRLPQYQIASFLGVSAEFLSKIIAKTAKK